MVNCEAIDWSLAIDAAGLVIVTASAIVAYVTLRKFRQSRGIDFVINAEGQIDPLLYGLMNAQPEVIKKVFGPRIPDGLEDGDLTAFVYMYASYAHVSRMFYLSCKPNTDLGMSKQDVDAWKANWLAFLKTYTNNPIMLGIHDKAMKGRYFNDYFLCEADRILGRQKCDAAGEEQGSKEPEK